MQLQATIHVERFDPEGEMPVVTADLSAFGGSAAQPLTPDVNGEYRLEEILAVERSNGQAEVIVWIRQRNDAGLHSVKLIHAVTIAPVSDAVIFADRPTLGWTLEGDVTVVGEGAVETDIGGQGGVSSVWEGIGVGGGVLGMGDR